MLYFKISLCFIDNINPTLEVFALAEMDCVTDVSEELILYSQSLRGSQERGRRSWQNKSIFTGKTPTYKRSKQNLREFQKHTVYKTPTKCTSLYHFFISIYPYICFGLCKNHHQGFSNLYIFTSNGIFVLIVMHCLSVQLPFTYKISLNQSF
jgi:hypothetical protein